MSRRYFENPHDPSRRHANIASNQSSNSSTRRPVALDSRYDTFQSNVPPNRHSNYASPPPRNHVQYSHYDEYPNSTRPPFNRTNVSQHFLVDQMNF